MAGFVVDEDEEIDEEVDDNEVSQRLFDLNFYLIYFM